MKLTQTVTVTREEYTMLKGTFADVLGMFLSKVNRNNDGTYDELMRKYFGKEITMDVKTKSLLGKFAFAFHLKDSIEIDVELEITPKALEQVIKLGFAVAELGMPVAVAAYEMAHAHEKIQAIKLANSELNELASDGKCELTVERNAKD